MIRYSIDDLLALMARLRDPGAGCPWDLQQDARSIINHSIEEVYELADAIEQGESDAIADELGDLLFQVVFLSRLGEERQRYDFSSVVQGLCDKLLRRHPHVFPDGTLYGTTQSQQSVGSGVGSPGNISAGQVTQNWDAIKQQERRNSDQMGLFANVPRALPAMLRARKLQKRAATIGLDWPDAEGAMTSVEEELQEFSAELSRRQSADVSDANEGGGLASPKADAEMQERLHEELGDLLFSCVNVARKAGINPEQALRDANAKFQRRAEYVDSSLQKAGFRSHQSAASGAGSTSTETAQATPAKIDQFWHEAKVKAR